MKRESCQFWVMVWLVTFGNMSKIHQTSSRLHNMYILQQALYAAAWCACFSHFGCGKRFEQMCSCGTLFPALQLFCGNILAVLCALNQPFWFPNVFHFRFCSLIQTLFDTMCLHTLHLILTNHQFATPLVLSVMKANNNESTQYQTAILIP